LRGAGGYGFFKTKHRRCIVTSGYKHDVSAEVAQFLHDHPGPQPTYKISKALNMPQGAVNGGLYRLRHAGIIQQQMCGVHSYVPEHLRLPGVEREQKEEPITEKTFTVEACIPQLVEPKSFNNGLADGDCLEVIGHTTKGAALLRSTNGVLYCIKELDI
jgi:hypothetical protein